VILGIIVRKRFNVPHADTFGYPVIVWWSKKNPRRSGDFPYILGGGF